MSELALKIIDEAVKNQSEFVDLGNCGLTQLPREIERLAPFVRSLNIGSSYWDSQSRMFVFSPNNEGPNRLHLYKNGPLPQLELLQSLQLYGAQIGDDGAEQIAQLKSVTYLNIMGNDIGARGVRHLSDMNELVSLIISENRIGNYGAILLVLLENLQHLSIYSNQLGANGAHAISKLKKLSSLDIGFNNIGAEGAEHIANLTNLTTLDIWKNNIGNAGAEAISSIEGIDNLDVWENNIESIGAKSLAQLSMLKQLQIGANPIGIEGITHLSHLENLKILNCINTKLTDKGSAVLSRFSNLEQLSIGNNQLQTEGAKAITMLDKLEFLNISGNWLSVEDVRIIIRGIGKNLKEINVSLNLVDSIPEGLHSNLAGLRSYFQLKNEDLTSNQSIKLILLGNTKAGKSSLAGYLSKGQYPATDSTFGMQHWTWEFGKEPKIKVNIWDFGGQDYFHATQDIFLSDQSMNLVLFHNLMPDDFDEGDKVLDEAREYRSQQWPCTYWLGNVRWYGRESHLWTVQTFADHPEGHREWFGSEQAEYFGIENQFYVSLEACNKEIGDSEYFIEHIEEFDRFRTRLQRKLKNMLPAEVPPKSWIKVRDFLIPKWRSKGTWEMSRDVFRQKCLDELNEGDSGEEKLIFSGMVEFLERSGDLIRFPESENLNGQFIIHPIKLSQKIYELLSKEAKDQGGQFSLSESSTRTERKLVDILLEFGLIFRKAVGKHTYIAPQFLPDNPYTRAIADLVQVSFILLFPEFMPRSMITRFIVEYASSGEGDFYWKYGAYFQKEGIPVLVRIDVEHPPGIKIFVHVGQGKERYIVMQELFGFFALDKNKVFVLKREPIGAKATNLFSYLYGNPVWDFQPLPHLQISTDGENFATIEAIQKALKLNLRSMPSLQGGEFKFNAIIHQLINPIGMKTTRIFLSYSHADEAYKQELDEHFSALKMDGLVEILHDRQLIAGQKWDKGIKDKLSQSDMVLCLLSKDFMKSSYIWQTELAQAKEEGKIIIPIFIRPCDWDENVFNLNSLQGLPNDEKWVESRHWHSRDEAYVEIIRGLRKIFKMGIEEYKVKFGEEEKGPGF